MREVQELFDYWGEHPPVHELVAAYLGVGKNRTKAVAVQDWRSMMAKVG